MDTKRQKPLSSGTRPPLVTENIWTDCWARVSASSRPIVGWPDWARGCRQWHQYGRGQKEGRRLGGTRRRRRDGRQFLIDWETHILERRRARVKRWRDALTPRVSATPLCNGFASMFLVWSPPHLSSLRQSMAHPTFYRTTRIDGLTIFYREAGPPRAPTLLPSTKARTRLGICSREALIAEVRRIPTDPHCPRARKNDHGESTCSPKLARAVADGGRSAGADATV